MEHRGRLRTLGTMAVCEPTSGMLRKGLLEGVESAWLDAVPVEVAVDLVEVSSKAEGPRQTLLFTAAICKYSISYNYIILHTTNESPSSQTHDPRSTNATGVPPQSHRV